MPRLNNMVHRLNPPLPLGEDEVSYEPFTWVRGLEVEKGRFVENTSPLSGNAKVEQYGSPVISPLALGRG